MPAALETTMRRVTSGLALLGAVGVVLMLLHVTAYVISRHFFSAPIPATIEIVSYYYMVLIAFLPISWAERNGDMISVEVFDTLYSRAFKRWLNVFVAVLTCAAYVALTYTTWIVAMREFGSRSFVISLNVAIPTWPSYFILPAAFALAAAVALYRAARAVAGDDIASAPVRQSEGMSE